VIKINLNQAMSRASRRELLRERLRWGYFWVIAALLGCAIFLFYFENGRVNQVITQKQAQVRDITARIEQLKKRGKNLSKTDIMGLADLESGRIFWAEKFMELSKVMPEDVAVTRLTFKNNALIINGVSKIYVDEREFDVINRFIDRLRNDPVFAADFNTIKFSKFSRIAILNQDVVEFEVVANVKSKSSRAATRKRA